MTQILFDWNLRALRVDVNINIGRPDKGASVVSLATAATAAAIFANADDHLSIWVENPSQYT